EGTHPRQGPLHAHDPEPAVTPATTASHPRATGGCRPDAARRPRPRPADRRAEEERAAEASRMKSYMPSVGRRAVRRKSQSLPNIGTQTKSGDDALLAVNRQPASALTVICCCLASRIASASSSTAVA